MHQVVTALSQADINHAHTADVKQGRDDQTYDAGAINVVVRDSHHVGERAHITMADYCALRLSGGAAGVKLQDRTGFMEQPVPDDRRHLTL